MTYFVFEMSDVRFLADQTRLEIHWLTSTDEQTNKRIEAALAEGSLAAHIRSALISERIMSYVPRIEFVRDNTRSILGRLDESLRQAKLDEEKFIRESVDSSDQVTDDGDHISFTSSAGNTEETSKKSTKNATNPPERKEPLHSPASPVPPLSTTPVIAMSNM